MPREKLQIQSIDEYILLMPAEIRPILNKTRQTIRDAAPDAREKISWEMPTYHLYENICHFAAQKNHLGFYPGDSGVSHFADRLKDYKTSKGAIQFPYAKDIPYDLIREIVIFRINEAKARHQI